MRHRKERLMMQEMTDKEVAEHKSEMGALERTCCPAQRAALARLRALSPEQLEEVIAIARADHMARATTVAGKAVSESDYAVVGHRGKCCRRCEGLGTFLVPSPTTGVDSIVNCGACGGTGRQ